MSEWKLVPRRWTDEMRNAFFDAYNTMDAERAWIAALAAAPEPAQEPVAWQGSHGFGKFPTNADYSAPAPSDDTLAALDWARLQSGEIRALDPGHQQIFDLCHRAIAAGGKR